MAGADGKAVIKRLVVRAVNVHRRRFNAWFDD
jgi:hypothetical protein